MKEETFEGDINRIKAWIHFKDGSDVDEDTQLLINDIKLLFDRIAERDARIAELESKLSLEVDKKHRVNNCHKNTISELQSKLSLAVEGLKYYAQEPWELTTTNILGQETVFDASVMGKTARETLKQIGETE